MQTHIHRLMQILLPLQMSRTRTASSYLVHTEWPPRATDRHHQGLQLTVSVDVLLTTHAAADISNSKLQLSLLAAGISL